MILINPIQAGRWLGLDTTGWPTDDKAIGFAVAPDGREIGSLIEYAARARAIERYPLQALTAGCAEANDGGTDGCPPAAVRHVLAGALVRALCDGRASAGGGEILDFFCGLSTTRDPDAPTNEDTPDEVHARAIDLAIDLLCAPEPVAEIVAGAAAWLLATYRGAWATARARRMLSVVGVRFPRAPAGAEPVR